MALVYKDGKYYEDGKEVSVNPGTGMPYQQTGLTGDNYTTPPFIVPGEDIASGVFRDSFGPSPLSVPNTGLNEWGLDPRLAGTNNTLVPNPLPVDQRGWEPTFSTPTVPLNPGQIGTNLRDVGLQYGITDANRVTVPTNILESLNRIASGQGGNADYIDMDRWANPVAPALAPAPALSIPAYKPAPTVPSGPVGGTIPPFMVNEPGATGTNYTTPPFMVPGGELQSEVFRTPANDPNIVSGVFTDYGPPTPGASYTTPPFMVPDGDIASGVFRTPGPTGAVGAGIPPFIVNEPGVVGSGTPPFIVNESGVVGAGTPPFIVDTAPQPPVLTPGIPPPSPQATAANDLLTRLLSGMNTLGANGYGYTPEEEAAIYNNALAQFNRQSERDLGNLQNRYEQYGWRTGAPEIGGQAINSLNQYMGDRGIAEGNMLAQIAEQVANRRGTNETTAVNNMLNTMRYMSDEEQRNFLNQQGISDRETQDYWMGVTTNWGQQMDAADVSDRNLNTWLDYVGKYDVTPKDYLAGQYGADSSLYDTTNSALRSYLGSDNMMAIPILQLLSSLAGGGNGGTTVNVGTGAGVGGSGAAGTAAGVADVIGDGGKWVWDTAKKAWNWVKNAGTDKITETPGEAPGTPGTQADLDRILGGATGATTGITGGYSPAGTAVAGTVGALAGAAGGGIMLAGQLLTNYVDNTVGAKAVKEQQRYFIDEIGKYESTAPLVKDLTPQELYNVSVDLMKVWTAKSGTMTKEQIWNTYGKSYLYDVNMAKQGWVKGRDY